MEIIMDIDPIPAFHDWQHWVYYSKLNNTKYKKVTQVTCCYLLLLLHRAMNYRDDMESKMSIKH